MSLSVAATEPESVDIDRPVNEVGGRLVAALQRHGVVWLTGREPSPAVVGSTFEVARRFFELPSQEKDRVRGPERGFWRGYQPVLPSEALERFEVGPVDPPADGYRLSARFAGMDNDNRWPARPDGFQVVCTAYYRALAAMASRIVTGLFDALGLDGRELPFWTTRQFSSLVLNSYTRSESAGPGGDRLVAHTDHGGVTLLSLDGAPGLEVMVSGRRWQPVDAADGYLLLLAGELLQAWSGGRLTATTHRVTGQPGAGVGRPRTTLVYFHNPSPDARVRSQPDADGEAAGDFFIERELVYQRSLADGRTLDTFGG